MAIEGKFKIDQDRCKGCGLCILECPKGLLKISEDLNDSGHPYVEITDLEACDECGLCYQMCPDLCITNSLAKKTTNK